MLLVVAIALYDASGNVLVQQRPEGKPMAGLWEFPGGKVEPGETPEQALVREVHEELRIEIAEDDLFPLSFVTHPMEQETPNEAGMTTPRHLLLLLYQCAKWKGKIIGQEGQVWQWADELTLRALSMPPADLPLLDIIFRAPLDSGGKTLNMTSCNR